MLDATSSTWTTANTHKAVRTLRAATAVTQTYGRVYYINSSGSWAVTNATAEASASGLLGISFKGVSSNYVMLEGLITILASDISGTYKDGAPLYLDASNNGQMTLTAPTSTGNIVRIVGYTVDTITVGRSTGYIVYFCPTADWIEI